MSRGIIIFLSSIGAIVLVFFMSCVNFHNTSNTLENAVTAQWRDNANTYDAMWKSIVEIAQVPAQYKEDFKSLLIGETEAKFGPNGSQATMQWFQERDIRLPVELYAKVQDVIESNRNAFKRGQTELLDKQRRYATHLNTFFGGMFATLTSFPKDLHGKFAPTEDLDGDGRITCLDYPIVTSARTNKAFATGEDTEIDVFGKKAQ